MAYTPELSYEMSCILRRIAWSLKKPMTYAIDWSLEELVKHLDSEKICKSCKDPSRCNTCLFDKKGHFEGRQ